MPSNTSRDLTVFKTQQVKAYSSSGAYLGVIADAPYLSGVTSALNAADTALTVKLPRPVDAYDGANQPGSAGTVVLGNIWQWYVYGPGLPAGGKLRYQGIVDAIAPSIDANGGESVEVTVTPFSSVLGDHGILGPLAYGTSGNPATYVDTMSIFSSWFTTQVDSNTGLPYGSPFTLDPANPATTGNKTFFSFQNQTLLMALTNVLLLSPANWYFRFNVDKTVSFNQYNLSAPTYILKIGQHFNAIQYAIDNTPRKNLIIVAGAGSIIAKAAGSSIATIGERVYMKQDSRITDQNTANLLAAGLLAFYDRPQIRAKVVIPDYRGDLLPGLGYDIEQFRPGQTVTILDNRAPAVASMGSPSLWGQMVWGRDKWAGSPSSNLAIWGQFKWGGAAWGESVGSIFNTVTPIVACTYNFHSIELELGFRQPSMLRALYALEAQLNDTTMIS